tara:strand:- start:810 stop:1046 length:237 start_codon:yes stop_codon:yes gene_type:complete
MGTELELINQFVNQLAMCELLSAHSLIQPSLAFDCGEIQKFIKESYFDNDYNSFIKWWDAVVVPKVGEFQSMLESRNQ